ncbi:MAG: hypothetical protein NVS3B20_07620 [Polyangiales bacterium]
MSFAIAVLASSLSCAAKKKTDEDGLSHNIPDDGSVTSSESGFNIDASDTGLAGTRFSADLQAITDDTGNVVAKCPPEQGCLKGVCVSACDAAAGSHGNVGCDFLIATPLSFPNVRPPCFAVFVANNWSKNTHVAVSKGAAALNVTAFGRVPNGGPDATAWPSIDATGVPANGVGVLFMSGDPSSVTSGTSLSCPVAQAVPGATAVTGSGKGNAFHIKTDVPVSVYDILPYGGASSYFPGASLILPTTAWGTNYVAMLPTQELPFSTAGSNAPKWGQIIASQDGTTVKVAATSDLPSAADIPSIAAKSVGTFMLNANEVVQWSPSGNMTGSVISSDKPIAFVGGDAALCIKSKTSTGIACDSAFQQNLPVSALGFEYVGAPYATRRADLVPESIPYRLVGAVDGTVLTFDPPLTSVPSTLELGQFVDFETTFPFKLSSQDNKHPFAVAQMMTGGSLTTASRPGITPGGMYGTGLGDPELVNVLPPAQFLSKYVFFTDPTYGTTNLVLTRVKGSAGYKEVTVDCIGKVSGWKPVGSSDQYQVADVDLVRGAAGAGSCKNGLHVASSDGAFGLTVWGTDAYASYAYPAGGNVGTINSVVVPALPK